MTGDTGEDTGSAPDRGVKKGTSRWQKVVGILGLLVILALGARMCPQNTSGDGGGHVPPPGVPEH